MLDERTDPSRRSRADAPFSLAAAFVVARDGHASSWVTRSHTGPVSSGSLARKIWTLIGSVRPEWTVTVRDEPTGSPNTSRSRATVTVNDADALLPLSSVAVHVTVVVPAGKLEPDAGSHVTGTAGSTMSVAVGSWYVTTAPPSSPATPLAPSGTPWSTGGRVSTTVTLNEPVVDMPPLSVTPQPMVVVPTGSTSAVV